MPNRTVSRLLGILLIMIFISQGFATTSVVAQDPSENGHEHFVNSLDWDSNGTRLATGSRDQHVKIWDSEGNFLYDKFGFTGHNDSVLDVKWSPDDQYIASGDAESNIFLWNMTNTDALIPQMIYAEHNNYVKTLDWYPIEEGYRIASGDGQGDILFWEANSSLLTISPQNVTSIFLGDDASYLDEVPNAHASVVKTVDFLDNGTMISLGRDDGIVNIYDVNINVNSSRRELSAATVLAEITTDDDTETFHSIAVTSYTAQSFIEFYVVSNRAIYEFAGTYSSFEESYNLASETNEIIACDSEEDDADCLNMNLEYSEESELLAVAADKTLSIYDLSSESPFSQTIFEVNIETNLGLQSTWDVVDVTWHPDGDKVSFVVGANIYHYDITSGEMLFSIIGVIPDPPNVVLIVLIVIAVVIIAYFVFNRLRKKRII